MVGNILSMAGKKAAELSKAHTGASSGLPVMPAETSMLGEIPSDEYVSAAKVQLGHADDSPLDLPSPPSVNLPVHHAFLLDEIASNSTQKKPTAETYFDQAAMGKTHKDISTQEIQGEIQSKSIDLVQEALSMGLTMDETIEYVKQKLAGHETAGTMSKSMGELVTRFGAENAQKVMSGQMDNASVSSIAKNLTDEELTEAIAVYNQIRSNPPKRPDGTPLGKVNELHLLAAAIGSILAPNSMSEMIMTPFALLEREKQRRDQRSDQNFALETQAWETAEKGQRGLITDLIGQKEFEMRNETTQRGQDIMFDRDRYKQQATTARTILGNNNKLTLAEYKRGNELLNVIFDDRYDADSRSQARESFVRQFGYDPLNSETQITPGYRQDKGEAETEGVKAKTDNTKANTALTGEKILTQRATTALTWARTLLTEEQANKVAVEADLLPEKFNLEVWKTSKEIEIKLANGQLDVAKLQLDSLKSAQSAISDTQKAFLDSAADKRKEANSLRLEAELTDDETEKARLNESATKLDNDAASAVKKAEELSPKANTIYDEMDRRSRTSGVDFTNIGGKYKDGKYTYSMSNRMGSKSRDCSSFVCSAYSDLGINVPTNTAEGLYKSFEKVDRPQVGDAVFFNDSTPDAARKGRSAHHVGIIIRFTADGVPIMRHMSSASNGVKDVRLDEYERGVRSAGLTRLGFGRPPGAKSSARPASKLADHTGVLAMQYGLPPEHEAFFDAITNPNSGWSNPRYAQVGDVAAFEDPSTGVRMMQIDAIDLVKGEITLRGAGKTFKKKMKDIRAQLFRPPTKPEPAKIPMNPQLSGGGS